MIKKLIYGNKNQTLKKIESRDDHMYLAHDIFVRNAEDLLYIIALLRNGSFRIMISGLHNLILEKIDHFAIRLNKLKVNMEQIDQAKYLICASVDEALLNLNNLVEGEYNESLISYYYKEELGGEHFFTILEEQYSKNIQQKLPLLNLTYVLLCLGFEGKYGVKENGHSILKEIKEKIRFLLEQYESSIVLEQRSLSRPHNLAKATRWWMFIISSLLFLIAYISFLSSLSYQEQELYELITSLLL